MIFKYIARYLDTFILSIKSLKFGSCDTVFHSTFCTCRMRGGPDHDVHTLTVLLRLLAAWYYFLAIMPCAWLPLDFGIRKVVGSKLHTDF